ncbi:MAG: kinase/pyrophosphorylase [Sphingomonadaceae bacterium]|nr:kinase/pyrophosphorylase [Sphingomonadaceae bacterium]
MIRLQLHLVSDSTGETLENMAKAALARFEGVETVKHYWPMVRTEGHIERVMEDVARQPGLILHTLVNHNVRGLLEARAHALGLPAVSALDPVIDALSRLLGMEAAERPGRQHALDAAYFRRVEAIQYTIAHDDGLAPEDWPAADIILAGVSRTSKTPTSIYLANRGYKVANVPLVVEAPPSDTLFRLSGPVVVGLTTSPERLIQVRRNRLLALHQAPETDYVDAERVKAEVAYARRIFADMGWPVIDVTRRSIEESAAAILNIVAHLREQQGEEEKPSA